MNIIPKIDPEFKALIPPLSEEERSQLEANILSTKKCRDAVILWNSLIVDGHNRYEICVEHGIQFEVIEMDFPSRQAVKLWILENQLGRRNLCDAMRIELSLIKHKLLQEKARKKQIKAGGDKKSGKCEGSLFPKVSVQKEQEIHVHKAIVDDTGVSNGTLYNYLQIKEYGSPELVDQVKAGKVKIGTAHKRLGKEILKELRIADKMFAVIQGHLPHITDPDTDQEIRVRLAGLYMQLEALQPRFKALREGGRHGHTA